MCAISLRDWPPARIPLLLPLLLKRVAVLVAAGILGIALACAASFMAIRREVLEAFVADAGHLSARERM